MTRVFQVFGFAAGGFAALVVAVGLMAVTPANALAGCTNPDGSPCIKQRTCGSPTGPCPGNGTGGCLNNNPCNRPGSNTTCTCTSINISCNCQP